MDKKREQRIIEMMRGDEELGLYQDQKLNELEGYILNWTSWVLMNTHAEVDGLSHPKDEPWWVLKMYEKWKKNSDFGQKYDLELKHRICIIKNKYPMSDVRQEMDKVIQELQSKGVNPETTNEELQRRGLGDVVESTLTKFGITQERYKQWFGLQECNCTGRKKWLNNFFSWNTKK